VRRRRRAPVAEAPARVAIVGGGCAAMAAAFELTRPEQRGRFAVTVYQQGWRLGGKGASGRGVAGRIEEHGLHLWMGWYENAFRLMRECYTELTGDPQSWRSAFEPAPLVAVTDRTADGRWIPWSRAFPPAEGLPGDPSSPPRRWTVRDYLLRTLALLRTLFEGVRLRVADGASADPKPSSSAASALGALDRLLAYGELATLAGASQAVALLETVLVSRPEAAAALRFLDALAANARRLLVARLADDPELRRVWYVIDLALATLRGYVTSDLLTAPHGFDAIDDLDCREWLRRNGASEEALDSGYLRGLYDLGFAYEDGDVARPRVSAAQALRGFVRAFFTYRGAFFWKMQGGMGDVVFAPLYEVLRRRGVRFRFFHRLTALRLARGRPPHVAALAFDVQARPVRDEEYAPLVDVAGMRCWPAAPLLDQLRDGARLAREGWDFESHWDRRRAGTVTLRVGRDVDFVVLGVGLGAIPHVCAELVARDVRWRAMVEHVKTVATQAFQLWLDADLRRLGWSHGSGTLSGFVEPFDTWADMQHLIRHEAWPRPPRDLAYFCSVLPDAPGGPAEQRERVRANAIRFLNHEVGHLWPRAAHAAGEFAWDLVAVPPGARAVPRGEARFDTQHWTANVNPTDRYTLALPGSARYRISPLDPTYDNLTVCGDWTDSGFNSGCVEAAVMSGRLAAHALSRAPALEDIVGFDHP
jgi:uncharacterized protein with NAD-binding domain and iron-sulfur cluster